MSDLENDLNKNQYLEVKNIVNENSKNVYKKLDELSTTDKEIFKKLDEISKSIMGLKIKISATSSLIGAAASLITYLGISMNITK